MGFLSKFLLMMFLLSFATGVQAECCWCECDPICHCPMGYDWGGGNDCSNPCGNVDCEAQCGSEEPGQYCSGYDDTCPSDVASGKKCKEVTCSVSGCHKYEVCDPSTGDVEAPVVTGDCHLEGSNNACQPNELPCSSFSVGNVLSGCDWGLDSTGCQIANANAQWITADNKWNVNSCTCRVLSDIYMAYKKCTGRYILRPSSSNNVTTVSTQIKYSCQPSHYYCTKCENESNPSVGLCPADINSNSQGAQCYNFDYTTTDYVACECAPVPVDYYVANSSFPVSYPLSEATTNCPQQCSNGMGTGGATGAIGAGACNSPSTTIIFEDSTGKFRLTSTDHCS